MTSLKNISGHPANLTSAKEKFLGSPPLPEKVLQFGTGILLRGLPDYYIDKANKQGIFNGSIVAVKSTLQGDSSAFEKQNNLYTIVTRGVSNGSDVNENHICSSISRVINANTHWQSVLELAANPDLELIISNTTEAGIVLVPESIHQSPPGSFPAKLTAFLYERYHLLGGTKESGVIVIPTELLPNNGDILYGYVAELAHLNKLPYEFLEWLENHVTFCNSLVDRIVPGLPAPDEKTNIESTLGYTDDLMVMAEPYSLWAIEGDDEVKKTLSFAECNSSIKIIPDISLHRELKLRLLNATHTITSGFAVLSGINTVKEAMHNHLTSSFITEVMTNEIANAIDERLSREEIAAYISTVTDRFKNPYIEHHWINITMQYTAKMKMRCVPVLLEYYKRYQKAPAFISMGFAAWLLFMKAFKIVDGVYYGKYKDSEYKITDTQAGYFYELWQHLPPEELVETVLTNSLLWDSNLSALPGFTKMVQTCLQSFMNGDLNKEH